MIQPEGIDLAVTTENCKYNEQPGVPVNVKVDFDLSRLDDQPVPVDAIFTWTGATSGSKNVTIYNREALDIALDKATTDEEWNAIYREATKDYYCYITFTGYANNTYTVTGTIMPVSGTDVDLSNNTATSKIVIYPNAMGDIDIPDMDIDFEPEIMVNIVG